MCGKTVKKSENKYATRRYHIQMLKQLEENQLRKKFKKWEKKLIKKKENKKFK